MRLCLENKEMDWDHSDVRLAKDQQVNGKGHTGMVPHLDKWDEKDKGHTQDEWLIGMNEIEGKGVIRTFSG